MLGRVAISLLSVSLAACATQEAANTAALPPSITEPAPIETAALPPQTTRPLPALPSRKPLREAGADPQQAPREAQPITPREVTPEAAPKAKPELADDAIVEQIIAESRARYPGPCACPYDTDRAGRRCGGRSAYSRPGGASPYCYPRDVPSELIERRRSMAAPLMPPQSAAFER